MSCQWKVFYWPAGGQFECPQCLAQADHCSGGCHDSNRSGMNGRDVVESSKLLGTMSYLQSGTSCSIAPHHWLIIIIGCEVLPTLSMILHEHIYIIYLKNKLHRFDSFSTWFTGAPCITTCRFWGRPSGAWSVPVLVSSSSRFRFWLYLACLWLIILVCAFAISDGVGSVRLNLQMILDKCQLTL